MNKAKSNIRVTPDHVAIIEAPPRWLPDVLTYRGRTFTAGGPTGWRQSSADLQFWHPRQTGELAIPAGLLPRVQAACAAEGYDMVVEDLRLNRRKPVIDMSVFTATNNQQQAFLVAMLDNPMGQLEVPADGDVVPRCVLIARAFPESRIIMATPTRDQARRLWWHLQEALGGIGLSIGGVKRPGRRCLVGTFVHVTAARECDILLLPYGSESTSERAVWSVDKLHGLGARRYALIVAGRRLHLLQRLRLEAQAGPVITPVKRPRSPIDVAFADVPASPCSLGADASAIDRKRVLYWTNTVRNGRIAEICLAAAAADAQLLTKLGLDRFDFVNRLDRRLPRVAVLVETVAHARELAELLPGWIVCYGVAEKPADGSAAAPTPQGNKIIAAVYAAQHPIGADILVRATGGTGLPRVKGFARRAAYGNSPGSVLLVDLADSYDSTAAKDARRRAKEYRNEGMELLASSKRLIE